MILPRAAGEGDHRAAMVEGEVTGAAPSVARFARATSPALRGRINYILNTGFTVMPRSLSVSARPMSAKS
jgi:hypothetical protein